MICTAKELCVKLNIEYHEEIEPYYKKGIALYAKKGLFVVDKEHIAFYQHKYNMFRMWFDDVVTAADIISSDEELVLFIYTLVAIIEEKASLDILPMPDRKSVETDYAPLFSLMYFFDDMIANMEKRGLSNDVITDTLYGFECEMNEHYLVYGRSGIRTCVSWFLLFLHGEIIRVGRFHMQFKKFDDKIRVYKKDDDIKILIDGAEVHKKGMLFGSKGQEDENGRFFAEITKDENGITGYTVDELGNCITKKITLNGYDEILKYGDDVISVHIPADGPLDYEYSEQSYDKTMRIVRECYPEYDIKAFVCWSWLMSKEIKQIMGRDTNITRFSNEYHVYPTLSQAISVYSSLFNLPAPVTPKMLPEKSSMQTSVKKYLMDGHYIYERAGIRFL